MEKIEGYFEYVCNDTIPTPPDAENVTPTDKVNDAVAQFMDNIQDAFEDDENSKS
jgi:hypothetical protein